MRSVYWSSAQGKKSRAWRIVWRRRARCRATAGEAPQASCAMVAGAMLKSSAAALTVAARARLRHGAATVSAAAVMASTLRFRRPTLETVHRLFQTYTCQPNVTYAHKVAATSSSPKLGKASSGTHTRKKSKKQPKELKAATKSATEVDPVRNCNRWLATRDLLPEGWRNGGTQGGAGRAAAGARFVSAGALKVCVVGAGGTLGRPLSLLLRASGLADDMALFDRRSLRMLQRDLARIDVPGAVNAFDSPDALPLALKGARVVALAAGTRRSPQDTPEAHFKRNMPIITSVCTAIAEHCPQALVAVLTTPVGACTALAVHVFAAAGLREEVVAQRVLGVTAHDTWRATAALAARLGQPLSEVHVPVVGGAGAQLAVPLFSHAVASKALSESEVRALTVELQSPEAVASSGGARQEDEASQSDAHSLVAAVPAAQFVQSLLRAAGGACNLVECAMVRSDAVCEVDYFAQPVELGVDGVQRRIDLGELTLHEKRVLARAVRGHHRELQLLSLVTRPLTGDTKAKDKDGSGGDGGVDGGGGGGGGRGGGGGGGGGRGGGGEGDSNELHKQHPTLPDSSFAPQPSPTPPHCSDAPNPSPTPPQASQQNTDEHIQRFQAGNAEGGTSRARGEDYERALRAMGRVESMLREVQKAQRRRMLERTRFRPLRPLELSYDHVDEEDATRKD